MSEPKKHAGGRPLKYKTVKELEAAIDEYFSFCDNKTKDVWTEKQGDMVLPDPQPYTVAGLAYHLGFLDRQALREYNERPEFSLTIKRARFRVEQDIERRMSHKDTFTPGLIFNAKNNFGYVDRVESDLTSGGEKLEVGLSATQAEQLVRARTARESTDT